MELATGAGGRGAIVFMIFVFGLVQALNQFNDADMMNSVVLGDG